MIPGYFLPQVESPQRVLKINSLHKPGLSVCNSAWFASSLTRASLSTDQKLKPWARKMTNKKLRKYNGMVGGPDVQTEKKHETAWLYDCKYQPGIAFGPLSLHVRIKEISTLLAGSTRVSRMVTRQGGLTRLDYCFHVNAYKHLTAKG